jgi:hypothetical protein
MFLKRLCLAGCAAALLSGCETDATVASRNISLDAGNFAIQRRIVFYNGITGDYILVMEGRCQVEHEEKLAVTCKTGPKQYKKHYLGLSDNVTYFSEQLNSVPTSVFRTKVLFKPESILPEVELRSSINTNK